MFGGETGQQITANIIGAFSNGFLRILELATKLGRDIMKCITQPIVDNKESIKQALEGSLEVISEVTGTLKDVITDTIQKAVEVYDEYLSPAFDNIESGISKIVGAVTDAFNTYIQPTLMDMAKSWDDFYQDSLKPVVDKALEVFGKLSEGISKIWDEILAPFVAWSIDILAPVVTTAFENISEGFKTAGEIITGIVDGLLTTLDGLIDFVAGVFTGDWGKAWEGVKTAFKGIVDTFQATIKDPIDKALGWVKNSFCRSWETAWKSAGKVFGDVFDGLKNAAKVPLNWIIDMINKVLRGVNSVTSTINNIPGVNIGTIPQIPKLARGGIVSSPTIAQIGEAGPEMIVPLENTSFVDKLASAVGNAVMGAMSSGMNMGSSSNGQPVVIEIDGTRLTREIYPKMLKEARRMGWDLV